MSTFEEYNAFKKLWSAQEFDLEICSGEITTKRTKQELSFLHGHFYMT